MAGHCDWPQHTESRIPGHPSHRKGDPAAQNQKGFYSHIFSFKMCLFLWTFTQKIVAWLTGGGKPALHHGLPEGELAEARPLGSEFGESAPRLPPLRHGASPRKHRRGNGGEEVRQAPGSPGTLTQYGESERHQLETPVQHNRVQTEELPRQRSRRRHHRLRRFTGTYRGTTTLQKLLHSTVVLTFCRISLVLLCICLIVYKSHAADNVNLKTAHKYRITFFLKAN